MKHIKRPPELDIELGNFTPIKTIKDAGKRVIDLRLSFEKLKDKCSKREKAHKACRDRNKKYNNVLKSIVILSSAFSTYVINFDHTDQEKIPFITTLNKITTFTATIFAGFDAYFDNGKNAEEHHQTSREYATLKHDISGYLRITERSDLCKDKYTEFHTRYTHLHTNSKSLFKDVRTDHEL